MAAPVPAGIELEVSDVSRQKVRAVSNVPVASTVGELVDALLDELKLPHNDADGRSLTYHALLPREGRHLQAVERVGDALETGDTIVLQPNVDAG